MVMVVWSYPVRKCSVADLIQTGMYEKYLYLFPSKRYGVRMLNSPKQKLRYILRYLQKVHFSTF